MKRIWLASPGKWVLTSAIMGVVVFIVSILLYPEWKTSLRSIVALLGAVSVHFLGPTTSWIIEYRRDHERRERAKRAFSSETDHSVRILTPRLKGIPEEIKRAETDEVLAQLELGRSVILTGEAGSGKSGIAVALVSQLARQKTLALLIDARRLAAVSTKPGLTDHFELSEPLIEAIRRQASDSGLRLVLDQIDNMVGTPSIGLMIDLLIECSELEGVEVVAVSRRKEQGEHTTLRPLLDSDFREVVCRPLDQEEVSEILVEIGVDSPSAELLAVGSNLLNLEIVCEIIREVGPHSLDGFQEEITLWERYRGVIRDRENLGGEHHGDALLIEAIRLARLGLTTQDRSFHLELQLTPAQARLVSNNIIVLDTGRTYRFQHEKLQDYLYAWDASERRRMPHDVYEEIEPTLAGNVLLWMRDRYQETESPDYGPFVDELLS